MQQTKEIRACRACLVTDCELYELKEYGLVEKFQQVTSLRLCPIDGTPKHICSFCRALLLKTYQFRAKCLESNKIISRNAGSLNCTLEQKAYWLHELKFTETLVVACGEVNKCVKNIDFHDVMVMTDDVTLKKEPVCNNKVISNDESYKSNISNNAPNVVNELALAIYPTTVKQSEYKVKIESSPTNELEENFIQSERIILNTDLRKIEDHLNAIDTESGTNSKCKVRSILKENIMISQQSVDTTNQSDLSKRKHYKEAPVHTGVRLFVCDICGKIFKTKKGVQAHTRHLHRDAWRYPCEQCGKAFRLPDHLRRHQLVHTGESLFGCDICGKMFKDKDNIQNHIRLHSVERPFRCDICGKMLKRMRCLQVHTRQQHNIRTHITLAHSEPWRYPCGQCGKAFKLPYHLRRHQLVHTGESLFGCDICGKMFKDKDQIQNHIRLHSVERPYPCAQCGKAFITPGNLKTHQLVHTRERPFCCDICGNKFKQKGRLRNNSKQLHSKARPYPCTQCGEVFKLQSKLKSHQLIHPTPLRL